MVGGETALEIRVLAKHGLGVREIAREVGVSRNTVRRYLRSAEAARYRERPPQPGKLSAFEEYVRQRLASALPERLAAEQQRAPLAGDLVRASPGSQALRCVRPQPSSVRPVTGV